MEPVGTSEGNEYGILLRRKKSLQHNREEMSEE